MSGGADKAFIKHDDTSFLQFESGDVPFISFTRSPYQRVVRDLPCAQETVFEPLFTHSQACLRKEEGGLTFSSEIRKIEIPKYRLFWI